MILHKIEDLSYLLHLKFLLNIKLHSTMTITQWHKICRFSFGKQLLKKKLSILKFLNQSKAAGIDNLLNKIFIRRR